MYAVLRVAKLKKAGNIGALNNHLERKMEVPNSDTEKQHLNKRFIGSDDLNADIQNRLQGAGVKIKKDSVLALEYILTASPEYFPPMPEDLTKYKAGEASWEAVNVFSRKAGEWIKHEHGAENVVNVHLHLDEQTPHWHIVVVPIDKQGKLNAKSFTGGRKAMSDMQTRFAEHMSPLGLKRGELRSKADHQSVKKFYAGINAKMEVEKKLKTEFEALKPKLVETEKKLQEQAELISKLHKTIDKKNAQILGLEIDINKAQKSGPRL